MIVNRNVTHNGVEYVKGQKISKSDQYFDVLTAKGFIDGGTMEEATNETNEPELTKAQITEKLTELGVEFDPNKKKADLLALLEEATNETE